MKDIPIALVESYQESVQHIAVLMKMRLKNGQILGFTDVNTDIIIDNVTYKASSSMSPSAIQSTSSASVDNLEIEGLIDDEIFTINDIRAGKFSGAKVYFMRMNYKKPQLGYEKLKTGYIGDINVGITSFKMEIRSLEQLIQNDNGRVYLPSCDANFGDSRCKFDRSLVTVTGSVIQTSVLNIVTDPTRTEAEDYFNYGLFTFTSGENAGYSLKIKKFKDGVFQLQTPFYLPINDGDTYIASAGCDKTFKMCRERYNNRGHFKGFPSIANPDVTITTSF